MRVRTILAKMKLIFCQLTSMAFNPIIELFPNEELKKVYTKYTRITKNVNHILVNE